MTEQSVLDEMRQVLDEVFRDRDQATRRDVYSQVSEHIHIPAETMARLNQIPDRTYTRQELTEEVDRILHGMDDPGAR